MIKRYVKKPVQVLAVQWLGGEKGIKELLSFGCDTVGVNGAGGIAFIKTPEGTMYAAPGDYIVKVAMGEFYPVKEAWFHKYYDEVKPTNL